MPALPIRAPLPARVAAPAGTPPAAGGIDTPWPAVGAAVTVCPHITAGAGSATAGWLISAPASGVGAAAPERPTRALGSSLALRSSTSEVPTAHRDPRCGPGGLTATAGRCGAPARAWHTTQPPSAGVSPPPAGASPPARGTSVTQREVSKRACAMRSVRLSFPRRLAWPAGCAPVTEAAGGAGALPRPGHRRLSLRPRVRTGRIGGEGGPLRGASAPPHAAEWARPSRTGNATAPKPVVPSGVSAPEATALSCSRSG